ncbi:MAG: ZIP family metal transporter [Oscillospiraceae bacterium]|nr:ZIP family metal transporter [Oscillospiraceae bacterium]
MSLTNLPPPLLALSAGCFTWLVTALGAATVFFFRGGRPRTLGMMLGFSAGVMLAASFWSLLEPAIALARSQSGPPPWLTAAGGFLAGAVFLRLTDLGICALRPGEDTGALKRTRMLILSITLHNIPEGLAVGVAFGALGEGFTPERLAAAMGVALGIGLQNYPEGAAVALPLRQEGFSRGKSFLWAQASGLVEPISALLGALLVQRMRMLLPWALTFAAGAMVLVAVHELIPACMGEEDKQKHAAPAILLGFALMMVLDVALG